MPRDKAIGSRLDRHYRDRLEAICGRRGWSQSEALRHAIHALDREVFGRTAPPYRPPRARGRPRNDAAD